MHQHMTLISRSTIIYTYNNFLKQFCVLRFCTFGDFTHQFTHQNITFRHTFHYISLCTYFYNSFMFLDFAHQNVTFRHTLCPVFVIFRYTHIFVTILCFRILHENIQTHTKLKKQ